MSETVRWSSGQPRRQESRGGDGSNLADILERVLDKGIVIAGDVQVNLLDIELLTIKIRLVVASVDRAKEMGIDWWERDPTLSAGRQDLEEENARLRERIEALEGRTRGEIEDEPDDDEAPEDDGIDDTHEADDADEPDEVEDGDDAEDAEDAEAEHADADETDDGAEDSGQPEEPAAPDDPDAGRRAATGRSRERAGDRPARRRPARDGARGGRGR